VRVLLTGAAGFIGAAVRDALASAGHDVIGIDAMIEQSHGSTATAPPGVRRVDVRDQSALGPLLRGVDVVCHQAAMVGHGVGPADLPNFAAHNDLAAATLLAEMAAQNVHSLVLASSMVVYGDGRYVCAVHGDQRPSPRSPSDLDAGRFDMRCPRCGLVLDWERVDEQTALDPRSAYAASKVAQEHFTRAWCRQTGASAMALRYHNVYGPGMPRDSPYSGVAASFRSALERGAAPRVFEDGRQMRDFVHVSDVAAANVLAVDAVARLHGSAFTPYNVASGQPISIAEVARHVTCGAGGAQPQPVITGEFRLGDVRHIVAGADRASTELGSSRRSDRRTDSPTSQLSHSVRTVARDSPGSPMCEQQGLDA
jgi:dTDP-L-rhamnose 4-epimerase